MTRKTKISDPTGTLLMVAAATLLFMLVGTASAQTRNASPAPRTAWGDPDLRGIWDFRSLTPFERPVEFGEKKELSEEEAAEAIEAANETWRGIQDGNEAMPTGSYNEAWYDVTGVAQDRRTSLIVSPADGRIPSLTASEMRRQEEIARERQGLGAHEVSNGGFVEELGPGHLAVRCIVGFSSGPPMTPSAYNNNVQVFQTRAHVALLNEMIHTVRIIPLGERPAHDIRQQLGASHGYWDGDTLVVETSNFLREIGFMASHNLKNLRLVERFTRVSPQTLMYEATVNDPTVWTSDWKYQLYMQQSDAPIYEYACHEGNYGLPNILAGAREAERTMEEGRGR
jgi:hypothetical protein